MFDTVAISKTFLTLPKNDLESRGAFVKFDKNTGEPQKFFLNGQKGSKEPRITISKDIFNKGWRLRAEVSISAWLKGSNIYLPNEKDLLIFLLKLSEYVEKRTGLIFNARLERVARADMTRDFLLTENEVLAVISKLQNISIPRYDRRTFNNTGVSFSSKGQKKILVYSKFHDVLAKNGSELDLENARGILRLEIQHKKNATVSYIAESLGYSDHNANHILTLETSEKVINKVIELLHLKQFIENRNNRIDVLISKYGLSMAQKLTTHLAYKMVFGTDYYKHLKIGVSERKIKDYEKKCLEMGISSLE
jgi:hypothetical protein